MIQLLAVIGLILLLIFIFVGIPLIAGIIVNSTDNDGEGAFIKTSIFINIISAIVLSVIIFKFINNPEQFGYQKYKQSKQ